MRHFLDYYRQFEELSHDEVSRELRARRDEERARALSEVPALDLATAAWHEPPDAEAVNAATYALRRAVNAYPDAGRLREAIAARHGTEPARVAPGHGAGELLRAALRAIAGGGEVAVAWPAWGHLPRLAHEAGARPVAVEPEALPATTARALVVCSPNDPTGAVAGVVALAERLDPAVWLLVDAALAEFAAEEPAVGAGEPSPIAELLAARERVVVVRSFSKAHALAGLRAGFAAANDAELVERLLPAGGVSAPAQAAMTWALEHGDPVLARRRAAAARERERLGAALAGTPLSFPAGHGPLVWLQSAEHDGPALAAHLATRRIYVTPGTAWGDDRHVRIVLRGGAGTDRLIDALSDLPPGTSRA